MSNPGTSRRIQFTHHLNKVLFSIASNTFFKDKQSNPKPLSNMNSIEHTETCQEIEIGDEHLELDSPLFNRRFNSVTKPHKAVILDVNPEGQCNRLSVRIESVMQTNQLRNKKKYRIRPQTPIEFHKNSRKSMYSTASSLGNQSATQKDITSQSYIVMNRSKKILISHNADCKRQIASITKLMTALTIMKICKLYAIDLYSTIVTVHQEASQIEGTIAGLKQGDQISIINLLYGMFLPSGNDAAVALAQYFGKFLSFVSNEDKMANQQSIHEFKQHESYYDQHYQKDSLKLFVFRMNSLASQIGLVNTRFQNPTGLQGNSSYSTAHDVAQLSNQCLKLSTLKNIMDKKIHHCSVYNARYFTHKVYNWKNTNKLLWRKRQCIGLKTGHTPWAGPCLSAAFSIKGAEVIIVVLKGQNPEERFNDVERLLNIYKKQFLSN